MGDPWYSGGEDHETPMINAKPEAS
jgi:hypothetical protein